MTDTSVFGGTGFIGSRYLKMFGGVPIPREQRTPETPEILSFISTVTNYNVFDDPTLDINTNLLLTVEMLESARKKYGKDFVFNQISTWFVYGMNQELPFYEDMECLPAGFYSITALSREQLIRSYCTTYGIHYRILRMANVLGPGDKKVSDRKNATQYFIREIVRGNPIQIYQNTSKRDFIHVDDACRAINMVLTSGKLDTVYNVGNGVPWEVRGLWDYVMEHVGYDQSKVTYKVSEFHQKVQTLDAWLDTSRLQNLGYTPYHGMLSVLDELIEYYKHER